MKEKIPENVSACFKLRRNTLTRKVIKTLLDDFVNTSITLNSHTYEEN